jgi:biopolymer transport protein ExbB
MTTIPSIDSSQLQLVEQAQIIFSKGGIMMIPLAVCSFIVLLVTIERLLVLRSGRLISEKSMSALDTWFSNNMAEEENPQPNSSSVPASILNSLVEYFPLSQSRLEERLTDLGRMEKHKLERGLVFLDTIAGIAPLFGLLGTALGMVEVFSRLSVAGEAKMSALSSGISQALFTTVTGLCIGIPSLIAFNLFSRHIEKILIQSEHQINRFIDRHSSKIIKD